MSELNRIYVRMISVVAVTAANSKIDRWACVCMCIYVYLYKHIQNQKKSTTELESERESERDGHKQLFVFVTYIKMCHTRTIYPSESV